jgi:anthranilate synthase component 2
VDEIADLDADSVVISPGPGTPSDAGVSVELIKRMGADTPILGVCLGHQAIAEAYGGNVVRAKQLMHGKTSLIEHHRDDLFDGVESPLEVMRYHSLTVDPPTFPEQLEVLAWGIDDDSEIHALRHRTHRVWGVQFHPESIMTQSGKTILSNFLRMAT